MLDPHEGLVERLRGRLRDDVGRSRTVRRGEQPVARGRIELRSGRARGEEYGDDDSPDHLPGDLSSSTIARRIARRRFASSASRRDPYATMTKGNARSTSRVSTAMSTRLTGGSPGVISAHAVTATSSVRTADTVWRKRRDRGEGENVTSRTGAPGASRHEDSSTMVLGVIPAIARSTRFADSSRE